MLDLASTAFSEISTFRLNAIRAGSQKALYNTLIILKVVFNERPFNAFAGQRALHKAGFTLAFVKRAPYPPPIMGQVDYFKGVGQSSL